MNTVVTSKEEILKACRGIVAQQGIWAVSMRAVAQSCGVSLGSLYNYFTSKDDLILAAIESVWMDIFHMDGACAGGRSFPEYVEWIFDSVRSAADEYPNFFTTHSLSFADGQKSRARDTMDRYLSHIKTGMAAALRNDKAVRPDAFDDNFSADDLIDLVLTDVIVSLLRQKKDCHILLGMIRRSIY